MLLLLCQYRFAVQYTCLKVARSCCKLSAKKNKFSKIPKIYPKPKGAFVVTLDSTTYNWRDFEFNQHLFSLVSEKQFAFEISHFVRNDSRLYCWREGKSGLRPLFPSLPSQNKTCPSERSEESHSIKKTQKFCLEIVIHHSFYLSYTLMFDDYDPAHYWA
jgi:hypothetical protein